MKLELILYTPTNDTTDVTFDLEVITEPLKNGKFNDSSGYVSRWQCNTAKIPKIRQRITNYNKGKSKNIITCQLVNPKTNLLIRI